MPTYQWKANSNAAPLTSDPSEGFIDADSPMDALREVVASYDHPLGLYSAVILEPTPENSVVARYLSARAATVRKAPVGLTKWEGDDLYVDGVRVTPAEEIFEEVKK